MEFAIKKNMEKTWDVIPTSGTFSGQVVAQVEGANLASARFSSTQIVGAIKALWGITVIVDDVFSDPEMVRALCIGRAFKYTTEQKVVTDRDGFKDSYALNLLHGAKRVMLLGANVYSKGQY